MKKTSNEITVTACKNIFDPGSISFEERQKQLEAEKEKDEKKLEQERNSPFSNWYQFNREHSKEVIWLAGKYPKAHQILLFLLDQMDNYNAVVCSYQVFTEALGMGRTSASTSIKILKEKGFIDVYRSGTANVYAVNKELAWSSWGTNYKYAKFSANIIISEEEQKQHPDVTAIRHKEIVTKN